MKLQPVIFFDSLPSTNTFIREKISAGNRIPAGTVVRAGSQTAGRGRFDRKWVDAGDDSLTFSVIIYSDVPPQQLVSLPLAVGLAVSKAMEAFGIDANLKWPNDVLVGSKKICGILCEAVPAGEKTAVIIGVGLNVNLDENLLAQIDQPATSMLAEAGSKFEANEVMQKILDELGEVLDKWLAGGMNALRDDWLARSRDIGIGVTAESAGGKIKGVITGLGEAGQLLITTGDGNIHEIIEGDVKRNGS